VKVYVLYDVNDSRPIIKHATTVSTANKISENGAMALPTPMYMISIRKQTKNIHSKCHGRSRMVALKNSYESQHNALLGMCVTTRGVRPLINPRIPSRRQMTLTASSIPRQ